MMSGAAAGGGAVGGAPEDPKAALAELRAYRPLLVTSAAPARSARRELAASAGAAAGVDDEQAAALALAQLSTGLSPRTPAWAPIGGSLSGSLSGSSPSGRRHPFAGGPPPDLRLDGGADEADEADEGNGDGPACGCDAGPDAACRAVRGKASKPRGVREDASAARSAAHGGGWCVRRVTPPCGPQGAKPELDLGGGPPGPRAGGTDGPAAVVRSRSQPRGTRRDAARRSAARVCPAPRPTIPPLARAALGRPSPLDWGRRRRSRCTRAGATTCSPTSPPRRGQRASTSSCCSCRAGSETCGRRLRSSCRAGRRTRSRTATTRACASARGRRTALGAAAGRE